MELSELGVDNIFGFLYHFGYFIHDFLFFIVILMPLFLVFKFMIYKIMALDNMGLPSEQEEEKKVNPMQEAIDDTNEIMEYKERIIEIKNKWIKRHDETLSSYMEERNNN